MSQFDDQRHVCQEPLLTIIRHPETIANVAHVLQGATDSPLTNSGLQQAQRLANAVGKAVKETFADERIAGRRKECNWDVTADVVRARGLERSPLLCPGRPPTHIFSSPLGRAKTLGDAIQKAVVKSSADCSSSDLYSPPTVTCKTSLIERKFGPGEGRVYSRGVVKPASAAIVDPKERENLTAETRNAFAERVKMELQELMMILQTSKSSNAAFPIHIVIITHGLWIRTFLEMTLGNVRLPFTANTGVFTLALLDSHTKSRSGRKPELNDFGLVCQNDTSHLIGFKRQRGGIGSSASDKRQQTLQQAWLATSNATIASSASSVKRIEDGEEQDSSVVASPVKRQKQQNLKHFFNQGKS